MSTNIAQYLPDQEAGEIARESASALSRLLVNMPEAERARVHLDGEDIILPRQAVTLLRDLLAEMAQGNAVAVVPTHVELTTQKAADILNVSRPHLVKLLEDGEIAFSKTGTHRRVRLLDVLEYKEQNEAARRAALDELTAQAQELDMGY